MTELDTSKLLGFRLTDMAAKKGDVTGNLAGDKPASVGLKKGDKVVAPVLGIKLGGKLGQKNG